MPRRNFQWANTPTAYQSTAAGAHEYVDMLGQLVVDQVAIPRDYTVERIFGHVQIRSGDAAIPVPAYMGIIGVNQDVAGNTPDPSMNLHADWMWWTKAYGPRTGEPMLLLPFDVRSRRKYRGLERIIHFSIKNAHAGAVEVEWALTARILLRYQ